MLTVIKEIKELSKNISVLYAEDEAQLRESVTTYLKKLFTDVRVVADGLEGLEEYRNRPADIVLSDILMPRMDGIEMIKEIKKLNPKQHSIILSAYTENEYFIEAIHLGVSSYIIKPIEYAQVNSVLHDIVTRITLEKELAMYQEHLEELVQKQMHANRDLQEERVKDYEAILLALINMIERRDSYTAGHSQRVAQYSKQLAEHLGHSQDECELVYRAGILHDIGKIATPDAILLKPSQLNALEFNLIKEHVNVGVEMLKKIPYFEPLIEIIISHHERYDGEGYPNGLRENAIHPLARVMIVADAFDAMTTSRIYRHRKNIAEALEELEKYKGAQFHPEVVAAAKVVFKDLSIQENISQLPTSELEEERFAFFYKDRATGMYNQNYLSATLLKNGYRPHYKHLRVISLHQFKQFNDAFGWEEGDRLLGEVAQKLSALHVNALCFRIHANDFIFLGTQPFPSQEKVQESLGQLGRSHVTFSCVNADLKTQTITSVKEIERLIMRQG